MKFLLYLKYSFIGQNSDLEGFYLNRKLLSTSKQSKEIVNESLTP